MRERNTEALADGSSSVAPVAAAPAQQAIPSAKKKLSYMEQREWDGLEDRVSEAESRLAEVEAALADPKVASNATRLQEVLLAQTRAKADVESVLDRWAELAEKVG